MGKSQTTLKPNQYLKVASRAVDLNDHLTAIEMYRNYLNLKPGNQKIRKALALQYYASRQFSDASDLFLDVYQKQPHDKESLLYYAKCLKSMGNYNPAIEQFNRFQKNSNNQKLIKDCRKELIGCNNALMAQYDPKDVHIKHPEKLNGNYSDFCPIYLNDSVIIFSSLDADSLIHIPLFDSLPVGSNQLYIGKLIDSSWQKGQLLPASINQPGFDMANGCFSVDKTRFYFTRCQKNWMGKDICSLYVSEYHNSDFQPPILIDNPVRVPGYTVTQPSCGQAYDNNLEIVYFASDQPGGLGGLDIWFTIYNKHKKSYSPPKNPGARINSPFDDITPFYNNQTKTLYFSSNRPESFGGFDIYKSTGELKSWTNATNMGYPINRNSDEFYFTVNSNQKEGLFVSNRPGSLSISGNYCCYDIFTISYNNLEQVTLKGNLLASIDTTIQKFINKGLSYRTSDSIQLKGKNTDQQNLLVTLFLFPNESRDSIYIASDSTDSEGNYKFLVENDQDYKLFFWDNNQIKGSTSVSTHISDSAKSNEIQLDNFTMRVLPKNPLVIENILYDFNSVQLSADAEKAMDSTIFLLLLEKRNIVVEISSYTDSVGDADYNLDLSQKRARGVVNYLVNKGIDKQRLIPRGYGESFPISPNTNADGTDNEEGRQRNRRTEFKIISELGLINQ